ncbi:MAG: hypothetical protein QOH26_429 [Actinomycetota bacterium]|nr:hypothetical protein [Actinomycetota bacterium]
MFGRTREVPSDRAPFARGNASGISILTGVVVAMGAMFLLLALIGGILVALDYVDVDVPTSEAIEVGIGAGIAFVIAQFLSYFWGGYTAGRMGRGAGFLNGLGVPIVSILVALIVGGVVAALGADATLNLPFADNRLPVEDNYVVDWGVGIGIASLVAMFLGGIFGGIAGSHWHTKLERKVYEEEHEKEAEAVAARKTETAPVVPPERKITTDGSTSTDGSAGVGSSGTTTTDAEGTTRTYRS